MTSSTCCLWASSKTVAMIFSIRTAISQPSRFCPAVARLLHAEGECSLCQPVASQRVYLTEISDQGRHRRVLLRINYYYLSDDLELPKTCPF
jgi:hypothetical protein